ncbi:MAG: hypothetical protein HEP71_28270 [Roseivirga sp.]|nr:hypothetical protein [Roseivirga sp.]
MSYKLKHDSIRGFSSKVSRSICDRFYDANDRADGASLMQFTKSKQANAFLVKILFEKWQDETNNLKSPYFDFKHEKVKEALKTFMNVLSGYISVKRKDIEPLLARAVEETVLITFDPVAFVQSVMARSGNISNKYIKTRKTSFKKLKSLSYVAESDFEAESPISPEEFVEVFGASTSDLFEEEVQSFFDQIEDELEEDEIIPEAIEEPVFEPEPELEPEPEVKPQPEPVKALVEEEAESDTINDRFNGNGKVQTLADKLKQNTRQSLESSLNLNERIMFTNSLFSGDKQKMSEALADIEEATDLDEAKVKSYKYGETWDMESDEVAAFFEFIERRFN